MSKQTPRKLTPEEVEEINRQAVEYLKGLDESDEGRMPVNGPKFDGPIGDPDGPDPAIPSED